MRSKPMPKPPLYLPAAAVCLGMLPFSALQPKGIAEEKRETVLDRVVHIERRVIRDIPKIPRLCDAMDITKQRVDIGDCRLYTEQEGKGIAMVLLHGGPGGTHHCFHPAFSRAKDFAKVIYYDQRGCGLSDYMEGPYYTVDQAVDDLERLRKALGVDRWIVLGFSYGGLLAQCYAVRYPDPLAGLVLVGSSVAMPIELGRSRQQDFLSRDERRRIRAITKTPGLSMEQQVYNRHLNGDWKRQHYYKPSPEKSARIALYEWKHDTHFNALMSRHVRRVDLRGAFEGCPIPTLIVEGKWDLTWNTDKPGKLHKDHPGARLVLFEHSGHSVFDDEPERFFAELRAFARKVSKGPRPDLSAWKGHLRDWRKKRNESLTEMLRLVGWGRSGSEKIAKAYTEERLRDLSDPRALMRTGFALYDLKRYEEALAVFRKMHEQARGKSSRDMAVSLIWQGHMLDLLGRRTEAVTAYTKAADLNEHGDYRHDQYGLVYSPSGYAAKRTKAPFERLENRLP